MTFEEWKQKAMKFETEYQYLNDEKEGDDRTKRIERDYWDYVENQVGRELTVEYASDLDQASFAPVSEMPYAKHPWNMNQIWKEKGSLLQFVRKQMSGVTLPWTYSGMMFSTFCWHYEDLLLYAMNYLHEGASKIWYVIPDEDRKKFENVAQEKLYAHFSKDKNFMLDINTVINPGYIAAHG